MVASTGKWYLEIGGKKTGPFDPEHIQGLLKEGEIQPETPVTSEHLQGRWITIAEMSRALRTTQDPALSLFDTLQAAKEKKIARALPPAQQIPKSAAPREPFKLPDFTDALAKIPRKKATLGVAAGLIGILAIWGLIALISGKQKATEQASATYHATATNATTTNAPPQPIAAPPSALRRYQAPVPPPPPAPIAREENNAPAPPPAPPTENNYEPPQQDNSADNAPPPPPPPPPIQQGQD